MMMNNRMLELETLDEEGMDLPAQAVTQFEGLKEGDNPNHPAARSHVRYRLGNEELWILSRSKFSDILLGLEITSAPGRWVLLTKSTGERLAVISQNILSIQGVKPKPEDVENNSDFSAIIQVLVNSNGILETFRVKETREEIKAKIAAVTPKPLASPVNEVK